MYRLQAIVREHREEFQKTCTELANIYVENAMVALKELFETHPGMTDYDVFSVPISNINFATKEITLCKIDDILAYKHEEFYDAVIKLIVDENDAKYADVVNYECETIQAFHEERTYSTTKPLSEPFVSVYDVKPFAEQLTKMGFQPVWFESSEGFKNLYPFFSV